MNADFSINNRRVLVISASDSAGAAGYEQDLRALSVAGYRPLSALTGMTIQTESAALKNYPADTDYLRKSIRLAAASDPSAVKIGALFSGETLAAVTEEIEGLPNIVWDPVFAPSRGKPFYTEKMVRFFSENVLHQISLCTPNRAEAERLAGRPFCKASDAADWAKEYAGNPAFLIKGGHFDSRPEEVCDYLVTDRIEIIIHKRQDYSYFRGSGCMLSSLIACRLAAGEGLSDAVRSASRLFHQFYHECNGII